MLNMKHVVMAALTICALLATIPSYAQKASGLTEASVRAFMDESLVIHKKTYPEYLAFLDKTTHDDFSGDLLMTVHKGNDAPIQVPISMDKKMILSTAREGYDGFQEATITADIHEIKISPDRQSATVKATLNVKNQKFPSMDDSSMTLMADSVMHCLDEIIFTSEHGIQSYRARYTADTTVTQEQEL